MSKFTRRFSPSIVESFEWLVLVGDDAEAEFYVYARVPDEHYFRRILNISQNTPIVYGRADRAA